MTMTKVPCLLFSNETWMYLLICNLIAPIVKWMQGADETEVKITQNNAARSYSSQKKVVVIFFVFSISFIAD